MSDISLIVNEISSETPLIRSFVLSAANDGTLPGFHAGAHIRVSLPEGGDRAYSLINLDPQCDPSGGVDCYRIGVRLEEESTGGSKFMHDLAPGERITVSGPKNDFQLEANGAPVLLIAGGIGITPITAMAAELERRGRPYSLHYSGRSRGSLAFLDPLKTMAGERLVEYYDDETATALDLASVIGSTPTETHIYVCGPKGMIEAVKKAAAARGFSDDHVHFELFTNTAAAAEGDSFEIELASSGEVLIVPAGKTIIDVLEEAGHDVLYDCQRGDCGICQTDVVSGTPDHRDVVLSDEEKQSGSVMQICVSRAKTPRLVLDL